jgi:hypothetical protein
MDSIPDSLAAEPRETRFVETEGSRIASTAFVGAKPPKIVSPIVTATLLLENDNVSFDVDPSRVAFDALKDDTVEKDMTAMM